MNSRAPMRKMTTDDVTRFKANLIVTGGNKTKAAQLTNPEYSSPKDRGYRLAKAGEKLNHIEYINDSINRGAARAIDRINELVESENEQIATKNSHFLVDHAIGKPLQRSDTRNVNLNIQSVLD